MFRRPPRRAFFQVLCGAAAAASMPWRVAADTGLEAASLGGGLWHITGAGGNVVVLEGADGLLMVNGGQRERSADLLRLIGDRCSGKPVVTLFNTDWHPDHTGSNERLAAGGTRIIAHENTRQYLGVGLAADWDDRRYAPQPASALPAETFYASGTTMFAGQRVDYGYLGQAHTDGDSYVFFPAQNVLVAGDVVTVGTYPIPDYRSGGWLGGLAAATKTLLDLSNADTRVVPGAGPIQTRADLQAQYDMLTTLRDRLARMMRQGMSASDMLAAGATKEFDPRWGAPERFVPAAYRGLWLHVRELGGIV